MIYKRNGIWHAKRKGTRNDRATNHLFRGNGKSDYGQKEGPDEKADKASAEFPSRRVVSGCLQSFRVVDVLGS